MPLRVFTWSKVTHLALTRQPRPPTLGTAAVTVVLILVLNFSPPTGCPMWPSLSISWTLTVGYLCFPSSLPQPKVSQSMSPAFLKPDLAYNTKYT